MPMNPRLLRPRASGFNPKSLSGLAAWYDAADSTTLTLATGVSQWNDKSGNGLHLTQSIGNNQPISGTRTIGGKNALDFDGSNDCLSSSFAIDLYARRETTAFLVAATDTTSTAVQQYLVWERTNATDYTSGGWIGRRTTKPEVAIGDGRASDSPTQVGTRVQAFSDDTTSAVIYAINVSGTAGTLSTQKNAVAQSLESPRYGTMGVSSYLSTASGSHRIIVGAGSSGAADTFDGFFNGIVGEVMFFSRSLSASEMTAVSRYLGKKWGITVA